MERSEFVTRIRNILEREDLVHTKILRIRDWALEQKLPMLATMINEQIVKDNVSPNIRALTLLLEHAQAGDYPT